MSIFGLKVMALVFMVFDHLAEFFPNLMPLEMRWIGRMSAPIFMFCMVQGLVHTSSRKRYLMRLYIGSFIMGVGSFALNIIFSDSVVPITNNIFATLFLIAALITGYESIKQKKTKSIFWIDFSPYTNGYCDSYYIYHHSILFKYGFYGYSCIWLFYWRNFT